MKNDYLKTQSRKWKLVLLIILITTSLVLFPPIISSWVFHSTNPLKILTGTEYVSVITLIVTTYFGANVAQKYVENKK